MQGWQVAAKQLDSGRGEDYEYLRRFLSRADADALWARLRAPDGVWAVRWWKPGTREEWWVLLTAEGGFWERYCQLPEEAPGQRIDRERAQAIATQTLRQLGFPVHRMRLFDSSSHQFPARSFHRFTWQMEGVRVGQAQFHLVVDVEGDVAANIFREVNAPSSYRFQQQRTTIWQAAGAILTAGVFLMLVIWSWRVHVRLMRQPGIPWKAMLLPAGVVSVLPPLLFLLNLRAHLYSAPTTLPPQAWLLGVAAATLALSAVLFVGLWQLAPYIPAWRNAFPDSPDPLQWWRALTRPPAHRRVWREAIVAQAAVWAGVGIVAILGDLVELLALPGGRNVSIPAWLLHWQMSNPITAQSILSYSPLSYSLIAALLVGLLAFWLWIGLVAGARSMFSGWRQVALWYLLLLAPAALLLDEGWERAQYLLGVIALFGVLWGLYRTILRWNPLTLFVAGVFATLLVEGAALLHYAQHRQEGIALWLVVVAVLLWAWWNGWRERRQVCVRSERL